MLPVNMLSPLRRLYSPLRQRLYGPPFPSGSAAPRVGNKTRRGGRNSFDHPAVRQRQKGQIRFLFCPCHLPADVINGKKTSPPDKTNGCCRRPCRERLHKKEGSANFALPSLCTIRKQICKRTLITKFDALVRAPAAQRSVRRGAASDVTLPIRAPNSL